MHDNHIDLAEAHLDKIAQDAFDIVAEGVVVGIDGAVFWAAERVAGGAVVEGGRDGAGGARGDALADLLDDQGIVADGHMRAVRFDAAGGDQ